MLFALLPWSFEWQLEAFALNFPAEVLIAVIALANYRILGQQKKRLFGIGMAGLATGGVMVLASTMPLVTLKRLIVDFAYFWVFALVLARYWEYWPRLLRIFAASMVFFVLFALYRHAGYHFRADQALLTPTPFFSDHNMYSAVLVATFFAYWGLCKRSGSDWLLLSLFALGILFAGSRGASLSFIFGWMILGMAYLSRRFSLRRGVQLWGIIAGLAVLGTIVSLIQPKLYAYVMNDASLAERINRYKCAWRMAQEKPIMGFGAGTYQFQYLAFQKEADMTRISVQEPAYRLYEHMNGRGGGPHSIYFGTLAEHGYPGLLLKLVFMSIVFLGLLKEIKKTEHAENQRIPLSILVCIITIALHGFVNDLCHDARIMALIWGSLAYQFMSSSSFLRLRGASSS